MSTFFNGQQQELAVLHTVNPVARISKYDFRIRGTILGQKIFSENIFFLFRDKNSQNIKNKCLIFFLENFDFQKNRFFVFQNFKKI